jgi:hypothetical protein
MISRFAGFLLVAALVSAAHPASAQYATPVGVRRSVASSELSRVTHRSAVVAEGSRIVGAANGALIGAGIGTALGLIVAAVPAHGDPTETTMDYIVAGTYGAFFGLIIGGTIGALRAR